MDFIKNLLAGSSKKMIALISTAILVLFKDTFGLAPEQVQALEVLAASYIVGQGVADVGKEAKKVELEAAKTKSK